MSANQVGKTNRIKAKTRPATTIQAGMVRIQAVRMLPATFQRTAEARREAPTPRIEELMTWVVLSGKPKCEATVIIEAAAVSAAKP